MAHGALFGYVHTILDNNLSPREAVLEFAKGFGFMFRARDMDLKPGCVPPDSLFEPDPYHYKGLARAREELREWDSMPYEERIAWAQSQVDESRAQRDKYRAEEEAQNERVRELIAYAKTLDAPQELQRMKEYIIETLEKSIQTPYDFTESTAEELLASYREGLTRDVKYHDDQWAKEQERCKENKRYVTLMLEMLDKAEQAKGSEVPA